MKYLNLTPELVLSVTQQRLKIGYENFTFKGGEPHIKIDPSSLPLRVGTESDEVTITQRIGDFNDVGLLSVTVDALKGLIPNVKLHLFLPYFPGARQDRLMVKGEPFTAAVYVKLLVNMGFETITSFDLHSDVVGGMFAMTKTRFIQISNHRFVLEVLKDLYPQRDTKLPILISPDAGSNKKILSLAKYLTQLNKLDVVKCDKTRDVTTGEITNFDVYTDDLNGKDCIIVDDICDGGGTFLGLAKELKNKNCGKLYLVVSHGIFSKDINTLLNVFDKIYTTNSVDVLRYQQGIIPSELRVIKLNQIV
jgi:ribose-phosphate pyrophosphokinase